MPVHAIDGNHEDHAWLQRTLRTQAARKWSESANLFYQPRPSVLRFGDSLVGFLGGALHVDQPQQHNLRSQAPNYILHRHRQQAANLFNNERPNLIVTHSCPAGIGIGMQGASDFARGVAEHIVLAGYDPGPTGDCGDTELRQLWENLKYRPSGWVFGHFHRPHDTVIGGTRFVGVGNDLNSLQHTLVLWDSDEQKLLTVHR